MEKKISDILWEAANSHLGINLMDGCVFRHSCVAVAAAELGEDFAESGDL